MRTASIKEPAYLLFLLTTAFFLLIQSLSGVAAAAQADRITVSADPGTLVRWSAPATRRCSMDSRSWPALQETCYYPVDLLHKPGLVKIKRWGYKSSESAYISVEPFSYGTREIALGDIPQANPSPKDLMRSERERKMLNKVWKRREGLAKFALPLGTPASPLPEGKDFGKMQIFNGKPAVQPHMGADYPVSADSPVFSVAEGTVVLAKDLFFPGNAVFIDHGDGLISMYFHLSDIKVRAGQRVEKGSSIGTVGTTGLSSGPHLFFGVRWHGARIDPRFLFEDPAKIPAVSP
ncbi:MAG TPA: M23 family metallopeptidase [Candidatus Sulfobium mesophilum]|nr:M23 family metallopeptidase [Candidatus Sulfobium mesophilum]